MIKENKNINHQKIGKIIADQSVIGNVAVLLGGTSAEREISLLSGEAIFQALVDAELPVIKIDTKTDVYQQLKENNIQTAFIALHGRDGEDGVIQGLLKMLGINFTGSDTASSAIAMNKLICKKVWTSMDLPTAKFFEVKQQQEIDDLLLAKIVTMLGEQLFVKPNREGSSVGMSKVMLKADLRDALVKAQVFDDVLVEQYIAGKEYTVSILNGKTLPSICMQTPNEYYDYDAKYCSKTTEYFCPSGLSDSDEQQLQELSLEAFDALGCSGWGRVDFIRDEKSHQFILLEANTVPGMTMTSLVPKSAKAVGIDFKALVLQILYGSVDAHG